MDNQTDYTNELRKLLMSYLETLRRNLAAVPLDILKTHYKKPFDKLCQDIRQTASAYVKEITLGGIRVNQKYLPEIEPLIKITAKQSGILPEISSAAFNHQDIAEIEALAMELKQYLLEALESFYAKHLGLFLSKECQAAPEEGHPELYNDVTGCILRDGEWVPLLQAGQQTGQLVFLTIWEKSAPAT